MASLVLRKILFVLFITLGIQSHVCAAQEGLSKNFITWNDFRVEEYDGRFNSTEEYNGNQVIVVAKDGTGDSLTVQGAVDMVPHNNRDRVKILIQPGIYRERVIVPRTKPYISFIGKESSNTVITWNAKASDKDANGEEIGTFHTATVDVGSDYFCATEITFENTIVAERGVFGVQAVAFKITGDKAMFYKVLFLGSQDTLLDHIGTHYFYQCYIEGRMDFIFGTAKSLYQECTISSNAKNYGAIAAHHRESTEDDSGFSFVNCTVNGAGKNIDLGRAWGKNARTVYSYCDLDINVSKRRWSDMGHKSNRRTVQFGEYGSSGKGARRRKHRQWVKPWSYQEARPFLNKTFIDGDEWLRV